MAQSQLARITCRECDGWYASERELQDHVHAAHRRCVSEPSPPQNEGAHPESINNHLGTTKEEWAKLSLELRNRVQTRFDPDELEAIDRFILLASQGSVFDHGCR
jgi:hypothetical protein